MTTVPAREGIIYGLSCTCHPDNGIRYVGQTVNPASRLNEHRTVSSAPSSRYKHLPLYRWMRKHGRENVQMTVIGAATQGPELDAAEVYHIARLGTFGTRKGLNAAIGGGGSGSHIGKRGASHIRAKLTNEEAKEAYDMYVSGEMTREEIAEVYDVCTATIANILRGRSYLNLGLKPAALPGRKSGRTSKGTKRPGTGPRKFSDDQVRQMHLAYASGESSSSIGKRFGASEWVVSRIASAKSHEHLGLASVNRGVVKVPPHPGEENYNAKLNEFKVRQIHSRLLAGDARSEICKDFAISDSTVRRIGRGAAWKHLGLEPVSSTW